ncbi:MAG: M1 family metallopeptidase [Acidobacteriota bacterium]
MNPITRRDAVAATLGGAIVLTNCGKPQTAENGKMPTDAQDTHSFSQPEKIRVRKLALDLAVSFDDKTLAGTAVLQFDAATGKDALVLDTRDLDISKIETSADGSTFSEAKWSVGQRDAILGAALTVTIPASTQFVRIAYKSQPAASGLQWLTPAQTAGKKHPFLFSQNESIHARSWIPIQDSPGVRIAYTARIRAPKGLLVLMSAEHKGASATAKEGVFDFAMDTPIPAYLIALAVGDLQFAEVGPRTGVYAEPPLLAKSAREFEDMEKMVTAAESLYGLPFGGMENPRLTFATPTILAGDKSLVGLVSHELAHSWSGNLVTNATWSDFWLNEGFTTYIENRIQEAVYGRDQAVMEQVLARRGLDKELSETPKPDQMLHIDLKGRDPDEGTTGIPYNKGALMLHQMEQVFGRETFDAYLKAYFDHFAFQSITTSTMLDYLFRELLEKHPEQAKQIPVQDWVYEPGLPVSAPKAASPRLEAVSKAAAAFAAGSTPASSIDTKQWSTQEWLEFLQALPPLKAAQMAELDKAYRLTQSGNSEVLDQWLKMAIPADYAAVNPRLEAFLLEVGRQKFIRPLYTELMKTPAGQKRAKAIYAKARPGYHPIAQTSVDKIVKSAN